MKVFGVCAVDARVVYNVPVLRSYSERQEAEAEDPSHSSSDDHRPESKLHIEQQHKTTQTYRSPL